MRALPVTGAALLGSLALAGNVSGGGEIQIKKEWSAAELMAGLEARKVAFDAAGRIGLDPRVFRFGEEQQGVIVTDPVDVGPSQGLLAQAAEVQRMVVATDAQVPQGAAVAVEIRTGTSFFDQSRWSPWMALEARGGAVAKPAGRYAQLRLTLSATNAAALPSVGRLALDAVCAPLAPAPADLKVTDARIERIVRSPIEFRYERPDHPRVARFRQAVNLDAVVAGGKTDFDKLVLLMDWVASCRNDRSVKKHMTDGYYAWDIDRVAEVTEVSAAPDKPGKATIYGHCMSYAAVMSIAATALGYKSRHMAVVGFRSAGHEVVEAWVPSLKKWVYFDPSLSNYYMDKETGQPLNLIEMHDIVARTFVPDGKDMNWFVVRNSSDTRALVRKIGGQTPIRSRLGAWKYGEPMPPDYDWGWYHGYLAAGFVQMTPRTDFHANPDANPKRFGHYPGYGGYPFWVDAKTPPREGGGNWYTRMRDFYWTLDQASLTLTAAGGDDGRALTVEFGHSMPFFSAYRLSVDGRPVAGAANPFRWELKVGTNRLEVAPVDEFGLVGAASSVTVVRD